MSELPSIDEALALVLAHAQPLGTEEVAIDEAAGRVLAADAAATVDLPPFASSAMDGFAVRAADTPGRLRVVGQSSAGRPFEGSLQSGEAIVISTGAVVPAGADAVVPVESTTAEDDRVVVGAAEPGLHVRCRGGDVRAGEPVALAGSRLGPSQVGALAASGLAAVICSRAPRVGVLATGSELRAPGEPLEPGQIYESNTYTLAAQLASAGAVAVRLATVADDEGATRAAIEQGLELDMLITAGGVSVGPHDLVRGALAALSAREVFWRVAVKPGKPVAFAVRRGTLVFGLPGNPVSSLVAFELFVRPALEALQGVHEPGPRWLPGVLSEAVNRNGVRDELLRAQSTVERDAVVLEPLVGQESHMIVRSVAADALVLVPRGDGALAAGAPVSYLRL